ncbi:hypothetical protein [Nocardia sp. NPDC059239]|uniref:hypothetical protein n=1 Tax=Nocardia sp. NPDC059239 TaxID=3346785 RepID=UPI0036B182B7
MQPPTVPTLSIYATRAERRGRRQEGNSTAASNHLNALDTRLHTLRGLLREPIREIVDLDREFAALDNAPDGFPDLPPELNAPKEVRRLLEEANPGLLPVLEILEDARGNAVPITDPNQSEFSRCRVPVAPSCGPRLVDVLSGLDLAAHEPPGFRPDAGALVAMLADTAERLEAIPTDGPAVVQLAHCFRGFVAIGFACTVLDREFVPRPLECLPVAEKCASVALRIIDVIGPELHSRYKFDRQHIATQLADPQLSFLGPNLSGCVQQILRLTARMRPVLAGLAADESALPDLRHTARVAAESVEFIRMQFR